MEERRAVFDHVIHDFTGHPLKRLKNDTPIVGGFDKGLGVGGDDGDELIDALSKEFDVDWSGFDLYFYFGPEGIPYKEIRSFFNGDFFRDWRSGKLKADRQKVRNLTVGHLWQVCERGKWFDPE